MAILSSLVCFAFAGSAADDRIQGPIDSARAIVLERSVHPRVKVATDRGALAPDLRVTGVKLVMAPSDLQRSDLERFLEAQRDPSSTDYRNWLTPEQYGERFGLSEKDLALISSWLQSGGFAIEQVARARNWIAFSGTAAQIGQAFRTELHRVETDESTGKAAHFANTTEAWIPASLAGIVGSIRGLDDFRPKPQRGQILSHPDFNGSSGARYLGPGDLATIYDIQALYNAGFDGTGQKLAIAGQTDVSLTDLRAFRAQFNLPARDPQMVLTGNDPGTNQDDQIEASLDLEWSGAVARNATVIYVYSPNVFESLQYVIDQNLAPVISVSYGGCEREGSTTFRTLAQQANAEGITWVNAAGDSGAAGCDSGGEPAAKQGLAATFPADIPEVTAIGGSEFNEAAGSYWAPHNNANFASALSYITEKAWNDTSPGSGLAAGGGAPSQVYAKPWWQSGTGVPNDQARDVPDIALAASGQHDPYLMYVKGALIAMGGTSASSPSFAGIVSILNQYLAVKGTISKPGLGNINPALYNLAQNTTGLFHDIVTGNNVVPCVEGSSGCVNGSLGYTAGPGYDLATGLGSVDAFNLVTKWDSVPSVTGTTMTLTATPAAIAASAGAQLTAMLTVIGGGNAPAGSVTFSLGQTTLGSAHLAGSGATETAVLTIKGEILAPGANTITVNYAGAASFSSSSATATVSVTTPLVPTSTVVTASPTAIAQSASTVLTATVKQANGSISPTGGLVFAWWETRLSARRTSLRRLPERSPPLTVKGLSLAVGSNTITASYAATGNFSNSSGSVVVTVAQPPTATVTTVAVTPATMVALGTAQTTATVKPLAGNTVPTGTVTFSLGTKVLGASSLSNGAVTLQVQGSSLRNRQQQYYCCLWREWHLQRFHFRACHVNRERADCDHYHGDGEPGCYRSEFVDCPDGHSEGRVRDRRAHWQHIVCTRQYPAWDRPGHGFRRQRHRGSNGQRQHSGLRGEYHHGELFFYRQFQQLIVFGNRERHGAYNRHDSHGNCESRSKPGDNAADRDSESGQRQHQANRQCHIRSWHCLAGVSGAYRIGSQRHGDIDIEQQCSGNGKQYDCRQLPWDHGIQQYHGYGDRCRHPGLGALTALTGDPALAARRRGVRRGHDRRPAGWYSPPGQRTARRWARLGRCS